MSMRVPDLIEMIMSPANLYITQYSTGNQRFVDVTLAWRSL
jgi:hypothetical protein